MFSQHHSSDIQLENESLPVNNFSNGESTAAKSKIGKLPRRVLHFSDGTLEEYSSEEDEGDGPSRQVAALTYSEPKQLSWGPWTWDHLITAGTKSLQVCDFLGEHLASFFGITTPKYQYEIDEYNRSIEEEEEREKRRRDLEGGWSGSTEGDAVRMEPVSQMECKQKVHPETQRY